MNPLDPKSTLSVLKRLISEYMIDNFVRYTNDYADIIINMQKIQERINKFKKSMFSKLRPTNRDEMGMCLTITLIWTLYKSLSLACTGQRHTIQDSSIAW